MQPSPHSTAWRHTGCYSLCEKSRYFYHLMWVESGALEAVSMKLSSIPSLLKDTFAEWSDDNCLRLGASLAYYTLSSLIPLLLIVAAIASAVLNFTGSGRDVQAELVERIAGAVNNEALAEQITSGLTARSEDAAAASFLSSLLGFFFLLLSASGVFGELDAAFNIIWDVPNSAQGKGIWGFIRTKFLSFTLVLGVAFLLLVAQLISVLLTALSGMLPLGPLWALLGILINIGVVTLVFALLYKFLPDTNVEWRDVWVGGFLAAILWIVGQQLLALYFKYGSSFSTYGALGGVLAFLVYIYYSSQILFFGGEFTQVYARTHGSKVPQPAATDPQSPITREAAMMISTAATAGEQRHQQELAALKTRQYAAAATGGIIGLVGGALIGGAGLIVGLTRGVAKLRGR
jgi:membrane protein